MLELWRRPGGQASMTSRSTVIIDPRYRGPPDSGNGGYVCGIVGAAAGMPVAVRLKRPPPLDVPLELAERDGTLQLLRDGEVVAEARADAVDIDVPSPPSHAEAIAALVALRTSTGTAPPEFTQAAAVAAWSDDAHAAVRRATFAQKRAVLRDAFSAVGIETVASRAGLYMWVAVDDDVVATERLLEAGIVVSPGRAFGIGGEGFLRLALVPTLDECGRAAEAVIECLN